jgi:DnaJ like chaperone protein
MNTISKTLTGAGFGFLFAGPIGAAIVATVSLTLLSLARYFFTGSEVQLRREFANNIASLLTLVAISDRKLQPTEARFIGDIYKQHLKQFQDDIDAFKALMKKTVKDKPGIDKIVSRFMQVSTYEERLWLLRLAWKVALKDGNANQDEADIISKIGNRMGVSAAMQQKIADEHLESRFNAYSQLGISPRDSVEVIKKAYRRMARDNHPDRFAHKGESAVTSARNKFARISQAYKEIRKERGF